MISETFFGPSKKTVPPSHGELEQQADASTSDLVELLGHLQTCWDDERRQLAHKLHDHLGSSLTALSMHLTLLTQRLPPD